MWHSATNASFLAFDTRTISSQSTVDEGMDGLLAPLVLLISFANSCLRIMWI